MSACAHLNYLQKTKNNSSRSFVLVNSVSFQIYFENHKPEDTYGHPMENHEFPPVVPFKILRGDIVCVDCTDKSTAAYCQEIVEQVALSEVEVSTNTKNNPFSSVLMIHVFFLNKHLRCLQVSCVRRLCKKNNSYYEELYYRQPKSSHHFVWSNRYVEKQFSRQLIRNWK